MAKYLKTWTSDRKVSKCVFNIFEKSIHNLVKIYNLPTYSWRCIRGEAFLIFKWEFQFFIMHMKSSKYIYILVWHSIHIILYRVFFVWRTLQEIFPFSSVLILSFFLLLILASPMAKEKKKKRKRKRKKKCELLIIFLVHFLGVVYSS